MTDAKSSMETHTPRSFNRFSKSVLPSPIMVVSVISRVNEWGSNPVLRKVSSIVETMLGC